MIKKAALCLNGQRSQLPEITDPLYCTDGAYDGLLDYQVFGVIGDMDSAQAQIPREIYYQIIDQDKTDFEKALDFLLSKGYQAVDVYWAGGNEMDHFLGNLSVAVKYQQRLALQFFGENQTYFYVNQDVTLTQVKGKIISLYPFPEAVVSSVGLYYELDQYQMNVWSKQSIRNRAINDYVVLRDIHGGFFLFITNL